MKIFKKVSMVLCMCFAFTGIAACGGSSSNSVDSNGKQEGAPTESAPNQTDSAGSANPWGEDAASGMDAMQTMVGEALSNAKSARISFGFDVKVATMDEDMGMELTAAADEADPLTSALSFGADLLVSEKTDGEVSMKLDLTLTREGETESVAIYYIDDYLYLYDVESDTYGKMHYSMGEYLENLVHQATQGEYTLETLLPALEAWFSEVEIPEVSLSDIWTLLADYGVDADMYTDADGAEILVSYQDMLNGYLATYADLTMGSTLKDLLTSQIAYFDPTLDLENLFVGLASQGNKTVNDLANILENESQARTGASLQENIDTLLANELVQSILAESFDEETLTMINEFKLEAFLADNGTLSLDDFAKYVTEDETMDWLTLVEALADYVEVVTLADLDGEDGTIASVLTVLQAIDFSVVAESYAYANSEFSIECALGVSVDGVVGDELMFSGYLTITEISEDGVVIALPDGVNVVTMYENCGYCGVGNETVSYVEALFGYYCPDCVEELTCDTCNETTLNGISFETEYFCEDCWDTNNGSSAEE